MVQKTYHIRNFTDNSFERTLEKVCALPEYQSSAQILLMVYEQNWDTEEIQRKVQLMTEELPKAQIAGITCREGPEEELMKQNRSILTFLFFEQPAFSVYHLPLQGKSDREAGVELNRVLVDCPNLKGVMVFAAELYRNLEAFFSAADEGVEEIPMFGATAALATIPFDEGEGYVFDHTGCYAEHMLVVLIHGEQLHLKVSYNYGWTPVGRPMTITEMAGDFNIRTIDNQPATQIYRKYLGLDGSQIHMLNMCEFPLIIEKNGIPIARIPLGGERDGTLRFACAIQEGEQVRFSYGAQQRIFSQIYHDSREFHDFVPQGLFLIICMNRLLFLKEQESNEIEYYRQFTPELSYAYGNSEIYRKDGVGGEMNSALVAIGIREGEPGTLHEFKYASCLLEDALRDEEIIPLEYRVMTFMNAVTEELLEMTAQAKAANEAKSRFLSNMSHEIRTPINAVLGMNEMVLRESSEQQIRDYAKDIQNAGNTLLSLINDILDVSKIESGKMEIVPENYDLSSMIHDLAQMISLRARNKNLALHVSVAEDLPSELYGDDVRIRQVLTNILTNAVKYTEKGSVMMRIDGEREGGDLLLHCEVEDTGIGIKEEDMPRLFSAFERIEEKRNRKIEGTGLGMNITLRLLQMMDSKLEVESVYGQGSRFWFTLRQRIVNDTPMGNFAERIKNLSADYQYERSFVAPEARILVVDDNALNLKVFVNLLKQTQVQITTAESGRECLSYAGAEHYDIIFLDHMMPEMDGIETLHNLKLIENCPNESTPVYALTANAVAGAKEMYLSEGFDGFLSKPIDAVKLERVIRKLLPGDLIRETEERLEADGAQKSGTETVPEDLPVIEGLDFSYAWTHLPDRELLLDSLKDFRDMIGNQADKLQGFYDALPDEEALGQYRIQVHGMKSAAAVVGITMLAGMANRLEYAARDGEITIIRAMHEVFLDSWRSYKEKLKVLFAAEEKDGLPLAEENTGRILARLEMLKTAMELFDLDTADASIEELLGYRYPAEAEEIVEALKAAVSALDAQQADELAGTLAGLIRGRK